MTKRMKMSYKSNKRNFRRGTGIHKKNMPRLISRGGVRF